LTVLSLRGAAVRGAEPPEPLPLPLRDLAAVDLLASADIATTAEAAARLLPGKVSDRRRSAVAESASLDTPSRAPLAERTARRRAGPVESSSRAAASAAPAAARDAAADRRRDQDRRNADHHTTWRADHFFFCSGGVPLPAPRMGICSAPAAGVKVNKESGASGFRFQPLKS